MALSKNSKRYKQIMAAVAASARARRKRKASTPIGAQIEVRVTRKVEPVQANGDGTPNEGDIRGAVRSRIAAIFREELAAAIGEDK